jgi:carboxypeptidase PM20D1
LAIRTSRASDAVKKFLALLASTVALIAGVIVASALRHTAIEAPVVPAREVVLPEGAIDRLAGAIRIPTISPEDPTSFDAAPFQALHAYLQLQFPRVHSQLEREIVGEHSLLYTWRGSDAGLKPILLAGHLDVVPIEPSTADQWQEAPFTGRVVDGVVWGRGALDDKAAVLGTLEAVEMLLGEGFAPARTVYLAYGHDEEIGGRNGGHAIAELLQRRGVALEMVLDEGGLIGTGMAPGVDAPLALVGTAEKGFVSIGLSAEAPGGHSSLPPRESSIGILAAAIARLEAEPMPPRLAAPTLQWLHTVGSRLPFVQRAAVANLWLTRTVVLGALERSPSTNAMVRTTAAVTMFQAGTKDNVLASRATAVVNFRILPGDSIAAVQEHVLRVVGDPRVRVDVVGAFSSEPSRISSVDSEGFRTLERTIRSVLPEAIVTPYLSVVVTDSRHYENLTTNVFRFLPLHLTREDLDRMHGIDERLAARDYELAIRFYRELMLNAAL